MKTAVITTGGLGTRLLTTTKNNPKAMLPLYSKSSEPNLSPLLQPLIEIIFNNLYDSGIRRFCFIVGKKNRKSIIDHLTPDKDFLNLLKKRNNVVDRRFVKTLEGVYKKFNNSEIKWISQETPMGFGHALLSASKFVGNNDFLLHAGDSYFPSYQFLTRFIKDFKKSKNVIGSLLLQRKNDLKGYGIAEIEKTRSNRFVKNVEEKPKKPKSNMVILPIYIFNTDIFKALQKTKNGYNNELQVTDAIQTLLSWNKKILAHDYSKKKWFDIGTPENYFNAVKHSYFLAKKK